MVTIHWRIHRGAWVFYKWQFEEGLRKKKEEPSLDGKLTASQMPLNKHKTLLTLESFWNNRSPFSIKMDIKESRIEIYKIDEDLQLDSPPLVLKKDLGKPVCNYPMLYHLVKYDFWFEPSSQSTLTNYFVLPAGMYGVRMVLQGTDAPNQIWWKELIVNIPEHKQQ